MFGAGAAAARLLEMLLVTPVVVHDCGVGSVADPAGLVRWVRAENLLNLQVECYHHREGCVADPRGGRFAGADRQSSESTDRAGISCYRESL